MHKHCTSRNAQSSRLKISHLFGRILSKKKKKAPLQPSQHTGKCVHFVLLMLLFYCFQNSFLFCLVRLDRTCIWFSLRAKKKRRKILTNK